MRPPSQRSYRRKQEQELELTPMMSLFVGLVPFLLTLAVFTKVTLISLPLPKVAQTEQEIRKVEKEKFYLRVYIIDRKTKNQVRGRPGFVVDSNAFRKGPKFLPLTKEKSYDTTGLNAVMLEVKKKNIKRKNVIIISGKYVGFQDLVRTLDATREILPELAVNNPELLGVELFPDVIMDEAGS